MVNFAVIANAELVKLIQASAKFHELPMDKQEAHLARMSKLPIDVQTRLMEFFREENAKEQKQKIENLKKAYEELVELEANFKKEMVEDREKKAGQDDEAKMNSMLNNI